MATTPEKSPNTPSSSHKRLLADTWFLEIGSLLLGICAFVVIVVLLAHYDGKQQFQWSGVTLNAVVAVLAAVTRIGIVVPVTEALAQWKWMHFSKGYKPLSDFGLLDDASRGTRGSLVLLWEKKSLSVQSRRYQRQTNFSELSPLLVHGLSFFPLLSSRSSSRSSRSKMPSATEMTIMSTQPMPPYGMVVPWNLRRQRMHSRQATLLDSMNTLVNTDQSPM